MSSSLVDIKFQDKIFYFVTHDEVIDTRYLKKYVHDATKLLYLKDGKYHMLKIKGRKLKLISGVSDYQIINNCLGKKNFKL